MKFFESITYVWRHTFMWCCDVISCICVMSYHAFVWFHATYLCDVMPYIGVMSYICSLRLNKMKCFGSLTFVWCYTFLWCAMSYHAFVWCHIMHLCDVIHSPNSSKHQYNVLNPLQSYDISVTLSRTIVWQFFKDQLKFKPKK